MEFRTTWNIPPYDFDLSHKDDILLIGSCFSENIGKKLQYFGFQTYINPFGIIFHPLAIAKLLQHNYQPNASRITTRDGAYFHLDAHSQLSAENENQIMLSLTKAHAQLLKHLSKSKLLIITFGSAWGYYKEKQIVANCQKIRNHHFEKKLSDIAEMHAIWQNTISDLNHLYPELKILFTVSPVRHSKDGFVENQQSKARLIELVHSLNALYFPAYELMMDDLRDYRFYERDMIHPNQLAIDYIFERFEQSIMLQMTQEKNQKFHKLRQLEQHKVMSKKVEHFRLHQQKVEELRKSLDME